MLLVTGGIFICYIFFAHKRFAYLRFSPVVDRGVMKQMLGFSGWNILGSLAHLMKEQGANILLNIFLDQRSMRLVELLFRYNRG